MKAKNNFLLVLASGVIVLSMFVYSNYQSPKKEIVAEGYNADLSGEIFKDDQFAFFEGANVQVPEIAFAKDATTQVLGATAESKWIEVDLSEQKLYAWEGNKLYMETAISSGLPGTPTPEGEFRIWIKLRATKMEGGSGSGYYYLPNVPYVMFFGNDKVPDWKGYGIHGAYWHNDFGRVHSHGCVNLPPEQAKKLYEWATPVMPEGKNQVKSDDTNAGTRILIHQ